MSNRSALPFEVGSEAPLGRSPTMRALRRAIASAAETDATVLFTGETGTGKSLAAHVLHDRSPRRRRPFVPVDCGSLSPTLIEAELFGHERGAFTGATERRAGRFERSADGTVFLDEIGELPPALQAKLLRVLQDREYERVGGTRTIPMRARVVAATSRDLGQAMHAGSFRPELYYRLAVIELRVPPLRERGDDLPELLAAGIARITARLGVTRAPEIAPDFLPSLRSQRWPGNVRELLNLLERMIVESRGARLDAAGVRRAQGGATEAAFVPQGPAPACADARLRGDDPRILAACLRATGGNVARAARRLGLPRSTLRHRIARHDLARLIPRD